MLAQKYAALSSQFETNEVNSLAVFAGVSYCPVSPFRP